MKFCTALLACGMLFAGLARAADPTQIMDIHSPITIADYTLPIRVACVGDSITAGSGTPLRLLESYPAQLQRMLDPKVWRVQGFGVSGATLLKGGDKPYQQTSAFQDALRYHPNVVVIMLGTNDSKPQNWRLKKNFSADYRDLIEKFKALPTKPRIYICRPPAVFGDGNYGINEAAVQEEMPLIEAIARDEGTGLIDQHATLAGQEALVPDRVHPNTEGANLLARTVHRALVGREFTGTLDPVLDGEWTAAPAPLYDVRIFGAVGDGATSDTRALQAAIDRCHDAGGGTVLVAGGRYVTGTLYLKSGVCLRIESGAAILGSTHIADYTTDTDRTQYRGEPTMDRCLIFAKDATDIAIEGHGTIDGQGKSFPERTDPQRNRPKLIRFIGCSRLRLRDIQLQSPASWTSEWRDCSDIAVDGITIFSRANSNGDGLDFDGCTNVRVSNSTFDTSDDSICLQTSSPDWPCRDVLVSNCSFSSRWAGIRIGLLSRGDFEDVVVTNCSFRDHNDSGLKIQMNEGAEMKNMVFSNLVMKNVPRPVFITFCQKSAWVDAPRELPPMKRLHNLQFSNIVVDSADITGPAAMTCGFQMTGLPGHPIEGITFSDIHAIFPGGGTAQDAANVLAEFTPEVLGDRWPEYSRFGATVPSFGMYARHVKGITLRNVEISTKAPDGRPPVMFVDVVDSKIADSPKPIEKQGKP